METVFTTVDYAAVEAFLDVACLVFSCLGWETAKLDTGQEYICISQGPDCPYGEACYTIERSAVRWTHPESNAVNVLDTWIVVAHHRGGHVLAGGSSPAEALGNATRGIAGKLSVAGRVAMGAMLGVPEGYLEAV